ncbi:hypothetical protein [Halobaculum lipolyticum]|uniref:Uncharacterized protein n=1 Tax=Halobaculum lipolyticum TaxID=3032001 RepID=A0ABD5W7Z0_9EURY|nr:hypothetical protein [Halobaculum sp. DT31]
MAFDDLDQAEQEESDRSAESAAPDDRDRTPDEPSTSVERPGPGSGRDPSAAPAEQPTTTEQPSTDPADPAFGFDEAKQRPLYARQAAWDAFEDALAIDVEATLRRNDVRDTPKRELHDAALHVLAEHADEVAERVLDERGVDR